MSKTGFPHPSSPPLKQSSIQKIVVKVYVYERDRDFQKHVLNCKQYKILVKCQKNCMHIGISLQFAGQDLLKWNGNKCVETLYCKKTNKAIKVSLTITCKKRTGYQGRGVSNYGLLTLGSTNHGLLHSDKMGNCGLSQTTNGSFTFPPHVCRKWEGVYINMRLALGCSHHNKINQGLLWHLNAANVWQCQGGAWEGVTVQ